MSDIYVVTRDGGPIIAHTTWQGAASEAIGVTDSVINIELIDDEDS